MFTGLDPGEKQALADLQDIPDVVGDADSPSQDTVTDDIDPDSLRQRTNGDNAFFEELCESLQPL